MAIFYLLFTVVLASVCNGQLDDEEFEGFSPNQMYYVPALPLPPVPRLPNIPGLPQPPQLPTPPPLLMFGPKPPHFPSFQQPETDFLEPESSESEFLELPKFPTVEEIASNTPQPGGTFDGVFISSKSKASRTDDGKIKWKGGSTVILNDNGKVTTEKMGDSPPDVIITTDPPFPDIPLKFKHFKHQFNHLGGFAPHKPFKHFKEPSLFKHLGLDDIKTFVPKAGAHFSGSSSSSHSYSSNVNGVKSSGGSISAMTNVDGDVEEKKMAFDKSDPKP